MSSKIRFFVILMLFCLISLSTAHAYVAYLKVYITDLDSTAGEADPILLVDHANSPIMWKLAGAGCSPTDYTDDITTGEYGDGSTISTGSQATLTVSSSCTFYLQVDEVKVGSYYYGSCTADTTLSVCTTCAGGASDCPARGDSTWYGTPTNAYSYSYVQSSDAVGSLSNCNINSNFGSCSDEVVTQLDGAATTEFSFGFTA